ncbi:response regulator [Candidatus Chloroploca sp. M-50]|uniref:Response regulator n=2 Tax=Candidatus Chloroploca mongolica TaxID=2528176 RepID=A0ABS4DF18_9CHLR|nr:response regulator [Candidatus Chloroploca mongolica]MBP1468049.1 response regulator [Candidatus Chloroploca mongolica]
MVVEDEPATRRLYRFLLVNSNFTVLEAEDGITALEILSSHPCDVIITDMNMPRMGGIELTRTLRNQGSDAYIIMVTAFGSRDTEKQALQSGVNEYMTKPIDFEDLDRRVKAYFARQP